MNHYKISMADSVAVKSITLNWKHPYIKKKNNSLTCNDKQFLHLGERERGKPYGTVILWKQNDKTVKKTKQ